LQGACSSLKCGHGGKLRKEKKGILLTRGGDFQELNSLKNRKKNPRDAEARRLPPLLDPLAKEPKKSQAWGKREKRNGIGMVLRGLAERCDLNLQGKNAFKQKISNQSALELLCKANRRTGEEKDGGTMPWHKLEKTLFADRT